MATIVFVVAFLVGLCTVCLLVLGMLWFMDKSYERGVRKRQQERVVARRAAFGSKYPLATKRPRAPRVREETRVAQTHPAVDKAPDWDFPKRWSPTKGETHLGKRTLGEDGR